MKYILLIYHDEQAWAKQTEPERQTVYSKYRLLRDELKEQYLSGSQLSSSSTAATVKVRDGKQLTTDGPYAETKEQLGGYFLIEANDLDEAIGIAARIPSAQQGTIEVRPLV